MPSLWHTTKYNPLWVDPTKSRQCRACRMWKKRGDLYYNDNNPPICKTCFDFEFINCETKYCPYKVQRSWAFKCKICQSYIYSQCFSMDNDKGNCSSCRINVCSHMAPLSKSCLSCPRLFCDHCSDSHCNWCVAFFICKRVGAEFPRDVIKIIQKYLD